MIGLIDADTIIFYACHNKVGSKVEKSFDDCINHANDYINNILKKTQSTGYILAFTVGKNFRYSIYPDYKGNRKYKDKLNHFFEVKEYLINTYNGIHHPDLEADDIVCICRKYIPDSFIASSDKDLLELEGYHFNYKTMSWVITSKAQADYNFCIDMIKGQPGDNIKGIPGKGEVYAKSILKNNFGEDNLLGLVLKAYLDNYTTEIKAVEEFYKNYKCLKIRDNWEGFKVPEPIMINFKETNEEEYN
jgi:DNA polymerase-1